MIKANNIHKSYGKLHVLKGVDVSIAKGEVVSIVGKSGAGKTTLLHILGTLDRPDKGHFEINGQDVTKLSTSELASFRNNTIGFIFQFHHLLPEFTALENVMMPALIKRQPESESTKRAKELLDYLGLSARIQHKPNELSGGEQQRVAVARALMNKPELILADEPTGSLDRVAAEKVLDLMREVNREDKATFLICTHDENVAARCTRRITLNDGSVKGA